MTAVVRRTVVPTAQGELRGIIRVPSATGPLPGLVFVDGSGCGGIEQWDDWPEWIGDCGAVVLAHDKPGCGQSPGDRRAQSFADRAAEALAAVEVLRGSGQVDPGPGGADRLEPGRLGVPAGRAHQPSRCAPGGHDQRAGRDMAEQERVRIANVLRADGVDCAEHAAALAWVDERTARLR